MTIEIWIEGLAIWQVALTGFAVGFLLSIIIKIINIRREKPKNFLGLRILIDKRYAQLIEGAKGYHEITEILNEVERNGHR
jgi:predicted branched-subunit amino acid permease